MLASFVNVTWMKEGGFQIKKSVPRTSREWVFAHGPVLVPFSTPASPAASGRHETVSSYTPLH